MRRPIVQTTLYTTFILSFIISSNGLAEIILDGSTGSSGAILADSTTNTYEIGADVGNLSSNGNNLFHSFSTFNVEDQHTANFSGPASVENIVARVTGPGASEIDGSLSSSIDGANLYLINPNGIMFGANASLNITGSFYASTADQLVFDTNQNAVLNMDVGDVNFSSAPIAAFGFTQDSPKGISVTDSTLQVNDGKSISLVAGDITLNNGKVIAADGTIQVASFASAGVAPVDIGQLQISPLQDMGNIDLTNGSQINTNGLTSGQIVIRGGTLKLNLASKIMSNVADQIDTADDSVGVDIQVTSDIHLDNNSSIQANADDGALSRSKGVSIVADNIYLSNYSTFESSMGEYAEAINPADPLEGKLSIEAYDTITVTGHSAISTANEGIGKGANIDLTANKILIADYGLVDSSGVEFTEGSAGDISIKAKTLEITGDVTAYYPEEEDATGIKANGVLDYFSSELTGSDSGNISIKANDLLIRDNGVIISSHYGDGIGGDILIDAIGGRITVENGAGISLFTFGHGIGGDIRLKANSIDVTGAITGSSELDEQKSRIVSSSGAHANRSGDIRIDAENFKLNNGAYIYKRARQNTTGSGDIYITANTIEVSGFNQEIYDYRRSDTIGDSHELAMQTARSQILAQSGDPQDSDEQANNGGNILLSGNRISITDSAAIETKFFGLSHQSGNIKLAAKDISITNNSRLSTTSTLIAPNNITGNIDVLATESLSLLDSAIITKVNTVDGSGGNVTVSTKALIIDNSIIDTSANIGSGGNIQITSVQSLITPNNIFNASSKFSIDGKIDIETTLDILPAANIPETDFRNDNIVLNNNCDTSTELHSTLTLNHTYILSPNHPHTTYYIDTDGKLRNTNGTNFANTNFSPRRRMTCSSELQILM